MRRARVLLWTAIVGASSAALFTTPAMAIEEPDYRVVRTIDGTDRVEVRDYVPYVVAEVTISGSADDAGGQAFPILAGYIFGKNKGARRLEMTAPVTQTEAPVKLAMTAPVTQTPVAAGHIVQFVLPKTVTVDTAPEPLDPRVHVREMPAQRVAVLRYAGFWTEANYTEHLARLKSVLADAGLQTIGEPTYSRYDAPFKPWFMRRNEVWLPLARP